MRRAALLLAACASGPPPPIAQHVTRQDPPTNAAPTIALDDGRLITTGLPAVSTDGSVVVIAHEERDPRGEDVVLVARDRADRTIATHPVMRLAADDVPDDALTARIADANRWLAAQHNAYHLQPMRALVMTDRHARADGISIDWEASRLAIARAGGAPFIQTTPQGWLVADHPMYAGSSDMCSNEAFLLAASVDTDRTLAVITVAYMGTDTCWEPSPQEHVVHW